MDKTLADQTNKLPESLRMLFKADNKNNELGLLQSNAIEKVKSITELERVYVEEAARNQSVSHGTSNVQVESQAQPSNK